MHRSHSALQLNEALQLIVLEKGQAESMKLSGGKSFVIAVISSVASADCHELPLETSVIRTAGTSSRAASGQPPWLTAP